MSTILSTIDSRLNRFAYQLVDHSNLVSGCLGKDYELFLRSNCKIDVGGLTNIPKEGPFIIAGNHLRMKKGIIRPVYDALIASLFVYRRSGQNVRWLARPTYAFDLPKIGRKIKLPFKDTIGNIFENKYGAIMIDPVPNPQTKFLVTEKSIACLERGEVVGIMPEGNFSDSLVQAKKGLHFIAGGYNEQYPDSPVPVIPIAGWGMEKPRGIRRRKVTIRIAEPQYLSIKDDPQESVDSIMIEIAKRLPEEYRGYYSKFI